MEADGFAKVQKLRRHLNLEKIGHPT